MIIKNKYLVLGLLFALTATFVFGWWTGRLARDNASEAFICSQNDIIKEYVYDLDKTNKEILKDEIVIATQKRIIEESFVKKEELDSIFLIQDDKLSRLEQKIDQLVQKENKPIIIIIPLVEKRFNGVLLAEKFREQNNI